MADSRIQREAEVWIRERWLPIQYVQSFRKKRLVLRSGGQFEFDAVSLDGSLAVSIATNGGMTSGGKKASPKLNKIRSDALFLLLASVKRRVIVFSDKAMFELCNTEVKNGRFPTEIEIVLAELPGELESKLCDARRLAADEVAPMRL